MRLDELLCQIVQYKSSPNEVVLGSLVNATGSAFDWQRAEQLWGLFVNMLGMRPKVICYTPLTKAQTPTGRQEAAAQRFFSSALLNYLRSAQGASGEKWQDEG